MRHGQLHEYAGRQRSSATSIKSQFANLGLDTSALTELIGICGWDRMEPGIALRGKDGWPVAREGQERHAARSSAGPYAASRPVQAVPLRETASVRTGSDVSAAR
jgi:hypothetical protein